MQNFVAWQATQIVCLLFPLCAALPSAKAETRCVKGYWWGPDAVGGDTLMIAARYKEDVSWMATHLQGLIPFVVYNTNDSTATHYTEVHNGNEAAAYLQFIVDYYDCLPQYMAFIHAHRRDVKVAPDHDMDQDLRQISWKSMPAFASLNRSHLTWHFILTQHRRRQMQRHQQSHQGQEQTEYHLQAARGIKVAWEQLFQAELGDLPDELYVNGGGQFMLQRERIMLHQRSFYQSCLEWLADSTELSPWDKGMVFEYTWKCVFGEEAEALDHNVWGLQ
ncbi:hypothetical protein ABBQ32_010623 [Trebouxia sp. C0010 RCD-2024]